MVTPSKKRKVTIEYGASSRTANLGAESFKTRDKDSAMEIVRSLPLTKRAWFKGEQIFINHELDSIS